MSRHPRIAALSVALGVVSLAVTALSVVRAGQPLVHWASLANVVLACALATAGALLWRGSSSAYAGALGAWGFVIIISLLNLASLVWNSTQGGVVPWPPYMAAIVYVVIGYQVIRFLVCERRREGANQSMRNGNAA
jgi:hypothetical protein